MQTIREFSNQGEASFAVSLLQSEGFDAVLLDEGAFGYGIAGPIRLQVSEARADEAIAFLKAFEEAEPTAPSATDPAAEA